MIGIPELLIVVVILLTTVAPVALLAFIAWKLVKMAQSH